LTALSRTTKFGTHWRGNWASPTDGLHIVEKIKESVPVANIFQIPRPSYP